MLGPEGAKAWTGRKDLPSDPRASRKEVPQSQRRAERQQVRDALSPQGDGTPGPVSGGGPEGKRSPTEGRVLKGGAGRQPDGSGCCWRPIGVVAYCLTTKPVPTGALPAGQQARVPVPATPLGGPPHCVHGTAACRVHVKDGVTVGVTGVQPRLVNARKASVTADIGLKTTRLPKGLI